MRFRSLVMMMAVAAAAGCGGSGAPAAGPVPALGMGAGVGAMPSIYPLLAERERLSLTSEQVTALDSVAAEWRVENDTLTRRVRDLLGDDPRRRLSPSEREQIGEATARVLANDRRVTRAVEGILNADQRRIACELNAEARAGGGLRGGWPWCIATAPPTGP